MHLNDFELFTNELKEALTPPLPGAPAHDMLAPEHRKNLILQNADITSAQLSSVLILLYPGIENKPSVVFIRRVVYKGVHSGQISFPGGKAEKSDKDLFDTAFRETEEEIGVNRNSLQLIGVLSELYVPPSNFIIFPVIASTLDNPVFIPECKEVDEIITVPLDFFYSKEALGAYVINTTEITGLQVPGFMINKHLLWGATAMILNEFLIVARKTSLFKNS